MEWLSLLLRWTHLIVGIAWIGSSFYFVWLDTNLNRPPQDPENDRVGGDLWAVHGGGFYHAQKYTVSPGRIPDPLHWFKWEAYTTWLTGFALLVVLYYWNADLYLVDRQVADISAGAAVGISLGMLVVSWVLYDLLCRAQLSDRWTALLGAVGLSACVYGLSFVFGGRGVFMQTGAMLGTIMAANVLMVIIPGQRDMVKAMAAGREPDPGPGIRGKQRSMHNNYLTLPVLFVMLSSHYPMTFGHKHSWAILLAMFGVGAIVRHYFNLRNQGRNQLLLPAAAVAGILLLAWSLAPVFPRPPDGQAVADAGIQHQSSSSTAGDIISVMQARCQACHSRTPTHASAPVAPKGVMLDTEAQMVQWADLVFEMTVVNRTMPLANLTEMTEAEREIIANWYRGLPAVSGS